MTEHTGALAVVVVCLLALTVVPHGGPTMDAGEDGTGDASAANASPPGHAVSSTVVAHEARVGGSFHAAVLEADLAAAESARARAARLAAFERTLARLLELLRGDDPVAPSAGGLAASSAGEHVHHYREARALAARDLAVRANRTAAGVGANATARERRPLAAPTSDDVGDGTNESEREPFLLTGERTAPNGSEEDHQDWSAPDDWHRSDGGNWTGYCWWCYHGWGAGAYDHGGNGTWSAEHGTWGDQGGEWNASADHERHDEWTGGHGGDWNDTSGDGSAEFGGWSGTGGADGNETWTGDGDWSHHDGTWGDGDDWDGHGDWGSHDGWDEHDSWDGHGDWGSHDGWYENDSWDDHGGWDGHGDWTHDDGNWSDGGEWSHHDDWDSQDG